MTENEAIKMLNNIQVDTRDLKHALKCSELIETAVKALEEVQEYRKLGTVEEVREAVEKTVVMNPEITTVSTGTIYMKCPKCKLTTVIYREMIVGYCPKCGQRLESEE